MVLFKHEMLDDLFIIWKCQGRDRYERAFNIKTGESMKLSKEGTYSFDSFVPFRAAEEADLALWRQ